MNQRAVNFLKGGIKAGIGLAFIITMLASSIPASAAMTFADKITLSPSSANIGDKIVILGENFEPSTGESERYVDIYLTSDEAKPGYYVGSQIKTYQKWTAIARIGDLGYEDEGKFTDSITIPAELKDGNPDVPVELGHNYYVCAVRYGSVFVRAVAKLTIIDREMSVNPAKGPVDTLVEIFGNGFDDHTAVSIEYDGDRINIKDGDKNTGTDDKFISHIRIPKSTAGTHTLAAIVDSIVVEAKFTVEPNIILSPQSGEYGTEVTVSGAGFDMSKGVKIWCNDNTAVADIRTRTDSKGTFIAEFTVPYGVVAGIYNIEATDGTNAARTTFILTEPPTTEPEPTKPEPAPTPSFTPFLSSPENGSIISSTRPVFVWSPVAKSTRYEFLLSSSTDFSLPLYSAKPVTTSFQPGVLLKAGKTYFWRVRSIEPLLGSWSTIAHFTVVEEEAPTPQPVIQIQPASPDTPMPPTVTPQNDGQPYFIAYYIGAAGGVLLFLVTLVNYFSSRRRKVLAVERYKQKLDQWEAEGYNVSELRDKWFKKS